MKRMVILAFLFVFICSPVWGFGGRGITNSGYPLPSQGGTGIDTSASSGVPYILSGSWNVLATPAGTAFLAYDYVSETYVWSLSHSHGDTTTELVYNEADPTKTGSIDLSGMTTGMYAHWKPIASGNLIITNSTVAAGTYYIPLLSSAYSANIMTLLGSATFAAARTNLAIPDRIVANFDGGDTTALVVDKKAVITVPFACTITGGQILASKKLGTSGVVSVNVDIWREATATNYDGGSSHPASTDTICAAACPAVAGANRAAIDPATWGAGATLAQGDILVFNIDSVTDAVIVNIVLYVTRL